MDELLAFVALLAFVLGWGALTGGLIQALHRVLEWFE